MLVREPGKNSKRSLNSWARFLPAGVFDQGLVVDLFSFLECNSKIGGWVELGNLLTPMH